VENKRSINFHRFGLGDAGGPIDSRVCDLCNHVGFTDVAAPSSFTDVAAPSSFTDVAADGCLNKKSLDSRLRGGGP
jgi:hypothetical protein